MALINYVTQVQFGFDTLDLINSECQRFKIEKPLIVTDSGIVKAGLLELLLEKLTLSYALYDETPPNPNEQAITKAAELFNVEQCDGLIALGGGSSIDLAKGVAVSATHSGPLKSFAFIEGGLENITEATAPLIAIPTTAGTGSEVGRAAILILNDGRKVGIISPYVIPKVAICDPGLTMNLPPYLTAATGMDAITHCMETFMSPLFNPPADGIALDGLRRGWQYIEEAVNNPSNQEARLNMMSASMQGAMAFQKGLGCVHSLSHSLGGIDPSLHHGTLNAILLPAVIRFNTDSPTMVKEEKIQRMKEAIKLPNDKALDVAVYELTNSLGLPTKLSDIGVKRDQFDDIIKGAFKDHSHNTNPKEATYDDYQQILDESF